MPGGVAVSIRARLEAMVEGMPEGASVSLPVDWIRELLEEEPPPGEVPDLLDLEQASKIVGRAVSTVRTWCNQGEIEEAFKLRGREWRIPRRAFVAFLRCQGGDDTPTSSPSRGSADLGSWRRDLKDRKTG